MRNWYDNSGCCDEPTPVVGIIIDGKTYPTDPASSFVKSNEYAADMATLEQSIETLSDAVDGKVDYVSGKVLSTNDYTNAEKTKLAGIEDSANRTYVDSALSATSTNPVENKAVYAALNEKVAKETGKGLSSNDYTASEKTKLSGIETGANRTVVDSTLSETSANPIANKAVYSALTRKAAASELNTTNGNVSALQTSVSTLQTSVSALQTVKVDKVQGKGLSTNDFSNSDKYNLNNAVADVATLKSDVTTLKSYFTAVTD